MLSELQQRYAATVIEQRGNTCYQRGGGSSLPARWWTWVESAPSEHNPVDDPTGADCALAQPGDVWFLAGTHGGAARRSCTIPRGRKIYAPVINQICTVPAGQTTADALDNCSGAVDAVSASLDGHALHPKPATSVTAFKFTARAESSTGFPAGVHDAVSWGLWIGPLPLSVGRHVLVFSGRAGTFTTQVSHQLTVANGANSTG